MGDINAAMFAYKMAYQLDCRSPLALVNAARTYQQVGQVETAKRHIQRGLELDPHFAMSHIDLAQLQLMSGQANLALQTLDKALQFSRHMSEIKDVLIAKEMAFAQLELEGMGISSPRSLSTTMS
jgi:tetratricopeptide (TPR) repeat protein